MSSLPSEPILDQLIREGKRPRSFNADLRRARPNSMIDRRQPFPRPEHESIVVRRLSGNRQDTWDSQGSQESHTSNKSLNRHGRRRRVSDADRIKPPMAPVSMMSLPDYRESKLQLYWPPRSDDNSSLDSTSKLKQVNKSVVEKNPIKEFRRYERLLHSTEKSQIWAVILLKQDGGQEHVALKLVPCDHEANTKEFNEGIKKEYDLLAGLDHKHIIATVGSYVESQPGESKYGLLLFPLAPYSLRGLLNMISEHNGQRHRFPARWTRDPRASQLLNHLPCLCQAVIYIHTQSSPIKHKDIKCENVLIDKHGTIILADFDIAKKYTDKTVVVTTGATAHTAKYAPQSVKDGRKRGLESDIFSLGCVFLEMASMAFGETSTKYWQHLCGRPDIRECDHSEALHLGTIKSWIGRLKSLASDSPQQLPTEHFTKSATAGLSNNVAEFLDMISAMLNVKLGDDEEELLRSAWQCFSKFTTQDCRHCYPNAAKNRERNPNLKVPTMPARKPPTMTRIDTISEGSSKSSLNEDDPVSNLNKDGAHFKSNLSSQAAESSAAHRPLSTSRDSLELPVRMKSREANGGSSPIEKEDSKKSMLAPDFLQSDINSSSVASRKSSAPEIRVSTQQHPEENQVDRVPSITPSELDGRISTDGLRGQTFGFHIGAMNEPTASINDTQGTQPASPGAVYEAGSDGRPRTPDSHDSDEADVSHRLQRASQFRSHAVIAKTEIKQNTVRVVTFVPRERRGVSARSTDAIVNARLLLYEGKKFRVIKQDHVDQEFLDGAFFDIPPNCNVTYRMPSSSRDRGGELVHLRTRLTWGLMMWCWAGKPWLGLPRIRLMYVPGRFTDKALEECVAAP